MTGSHSLPPGSDRVNYELRLEETFNEFDDMPYSNRELLENTTLSKMIGMMHPISKSTQIFLITMTTLLMTSRLLSDKPRASGSASRQAPEGRVNHSFTRFFRLASSSRSVRRFLIVLLASSASSAWRSMLL